MDSEVRAQAAQADVVKVSLSAWDRFSFDRINRPHPDIEFKRLIEGQWLLRQEFKGEVWVEVFLIWGMNTAIKDVSSIASLVKTIGPDRVHLNTAVRPPCEEYAYAVPPEHMKPLVRLFDPPADVIADYSSDLSAKIQAGEAAIRHMLARRPCTLEQICQAFGLHRNEASKYLGKLTKTMQLQQRRKDGQVFYCSPNKSKVGHE